MVRISAGLNLAAIAESGQCFRWQPAPDGGYRIIARGRVLHARQELGEGPVTLDCSREEYDILWKEYLDLDTDYSAILRSIPAEDDFLRKAAAYGHGLRILRQEPWETLISFIISQRKNIPAIRQTVERLCAAGGQPIGEENGETIRAFPTPEEMARLDAESLRACGLGYRTEYIRRTARAVCEGAIPEKLERLPDDGLFQALCGFHGVGRKIALCVMLFGFHRLNAFPVDVWMERVGRRHYPEGIPMDRYAPYAGVMQQYMFAYERFLSAPGTRRRATPGTEA